MSRQEVERLTRLGIGAAREKSDIRHRADKKSNGSQQGWEIEAAKMRIST